MDLKKTALKHALHNAVEFGGKANPVAVIGKMISENPGLKGMVKEVAAAANSAVKEVNAMKAEERAEQLKSIAPELLEKKKAEKRGLLELENAAKGKVVTRIPPEPSKYAHIGHALSFLINYLYARKYEGKCILRFEDTNPEKSKQEYVDAILEDVKYLGIKPDRVTFASDDTEKLYLQAERLIDGKNAYACFCSVEKMREARHKGSECECRNASSSDNMKSWKKMLSGELREGAAVLRLRGNMQAENHVMRDPVIFRIAEGKHYRHGNKYRAWPLYDFENAVEDGMAGITHIMRSIEFGGMRVELQDMIKTLLKLPKQTVIQYGRFSVTDALTQGREIRELIERKEVAGWDDPRLVTIKALRRRGIQPETFADLAVEVGLSTTPTNINWEVISAFNRKYLDASSKRYFFVENPRRITVENAPAKDVALKLHPSEEKRERKFSVNSEFLISEKDYNELKKLRNSELVRLMDCLNFTASDGRFAYDSDKVEDYRKRGKKIIHWLPAKGNSEAEVLMPDATTAKGLAEGNATKIREGEIVQFARFGFCRLENREKMQFIYCHE